MVGGQTEARATTIIDYHAPFNKGLRIRRQQHLHNIGGGGVHNIELGVSDLSQTH